MISFINRFPVSSFLMITLLSSSTGWGLYFASQMGIINTSIPAEILWLAEFGPAFAAMLMMYFQRGLPDFIKRFTKLKVPVRWWLFSLFFNPALMVLALIADVLFLDGTHRWDQLLQWDDHFINRTEAFTPSAGLITTLVEWMKSGPAVTGIFFILLSITNGGISEETGWRGFAQSKLQEHGKSVLTASLWVSLMWGIWHTGLIFWKTIFTAGVLETVTASSAYFMEYMLLLMPQSIIYGWLNFKVKGAIWLIVFFHASYNLSISLITSALPQFPMIIFVILVWVTALVIAMNLRKEKQP